MDEAALYLAALLTGLLGAGHCIGMCGGISAALTLSFPPAVRASALRRGLHLLLLNLGRTAGYTLIGAAAGGLGAGLSSPLGPTQAGAFSRTLSAGALLLLGLYYIGLPGPLAPLERLGHRLWRRLQPLSVRLQPGSGPATSLAAGVLWACLPCGMVYAAAGLALAAADPLIGARAMLLFGLATLPTLTAAGFFSAELDRLLRHRLARRGAGALLLLSAAWLVLVAPAHH